MTKQQDLDAGQFSTWLGCTRDALVNETGTEVPCGDCNACCRSSYFIHIRPDETRTLNQIPKALLFPAPGLPKGNEVLGYDQNGRCPMLIDNKCSVYANRPLTCRTYDCRIFPAAGITASEDDKALIREQIRRWKFSYPTQRDKDEHYAVQAAATFLHEHAECFPSGVVPRITTQLAIFAIKVYDVFLNSKERFSKTRDVISDLEISKVVMEAYEKFEMRCHNSKVGCI